MDRVRTYHGEAVQWEEPDWRPLLELLGERLTGDFMWMFEAEIEDGTRLHAYKHIDTRRYVHLDTDGNGWCYAGRERYRPWPVAEILAEAFAPLSPDLIGVTDEQIRTSRAAVQRLARGMDEDACT